MNKEIGGFFELEQFVCEKGSEYHKNSIHLNLGRNALEYLIKCKNIKKIYLPYFLCNSVSDVCIKNNVNIKYYHINKKLMPIIHKKNFGDEYVYVVNYYGTLSKQDIFNLKVKYKNLIIDNVQAFFEKPLKGVNTLYSCRKFFGVPDGSYLYTDVSLDLTIDNSSNRFSHLIGRLNDGAEPHYKEYVENEKYLDNLPLLSMSNETKDIMSKIDYPRCKKQRISNYRFLKKHLDIFNEFKLLVNGVPFCYPLLMKNGEKIRGELIKQKIYIPTLWPGLNHLSQSERRLVFDLLAIPCDHRYNNKEMKYIIEAIKRIA